MPEGKTPQEQFNDFDFSHLWEEPEEGGLLKLAPVFSIVLNIITLIVVLWK